MLATGSNRRPYLAVDELPPKPGLARRLPGDLAWRFHALPLAEDDGSIAVAMADPEDVAAREAVASLLGAAQYVVPGDPLAINALLAEISRQIAFRPRLTRSWPIPAISGGQGA